MGHERKPRLITTPKVFAGKDTLTRGLDLAPLYLPQQLALDPSQHRLRWRFDYDSIPAAKPDKLMFDDFLALADGDANAILAYARRYGPLDICEHNLPRSHNEKNYYQSLWRIQKTVGEGHCQPLHDDDDPEWFWEPIAEWRRYARQALAIVRMAELTLRGHVVGHATNT